MKIDINTTAHFLPDTEETIRYMPCDARKDPTAAAAIHNANHRIETKKPLPKKPRPHPFTRVWRKND